MQMTTVDGCGRKSELMNKMVDETQIKFERVNNFIVYRTNDLNCYRFPATNLEF